MIQMFLSVFMIISQYTVNLKYGNEVSTIIIILLKQRSAYSNFIPKAKALVFSQLTVESYTIHH